MGLVRSLEEVVGGASDVTSVQGAPPMEVHKLLCKDVMVAEGHRN